VAGYLDRLFSLDGRIAAVTGGSSGIGRAMGRALAGAGARVVLIARHGAALDDAAAEVRSVGGVADRVRADLADSGAIGRVAEQVSAVFGDPDILVNAAGINLRPPLPAVTVDDWDRSLAVNLTAPFLLGQRFGPAMAARGWGRIINVASQQAFRAFGNSGAYGVSKGGVMSLTRSQAEEWSKYGVCCNAIVPGFVATAMTSQVASDPELSAALAARTMIGRNGLPADFEGAAVFIASSASDYVTGQAIFVDGGFSAT
jgi:NAD(P)-dependent dehydrogenase (short-subunit alcohol dehydrogenase family)